MTTTVSQMAIKPGDVDPSPFPWASCPTSFLFLVLGSPAVMCCFSRESVGLLEERLKCSSSLSPDLLTEVEWIVLSEVSHDSELWPVAKTQKIKHISLVTDSHVGIYVLLYGCMHWAVCAGRRNHRSSINNLIVFI